MATAREVIAAALEDAKTFAGGESATGTTDETTCLRYLNRMLAAWEIKGIDLAHITLAVTDTLDVPDSHLEAITDNLAVQIIVKSFGGKLDPGLKFKADEGFEAIRAYHFTLADLSSDNPLSRPTR